MNHLRLRTEYSFGRVYGRVPEVLDAAKDSSPESTAVGIADSGTWGHVEFFREASKHGLKPILGAEIAVVKDASVKERQGHSIMAFLPKDEEGLGEVYDLVSLANSMFYFLPRIDYDHVNHLSDRVIVLSGTAADLTRLNPSGTTYLEVTPGNQAWNRRAMRDDRFQKVATTDNLYPRVGDKDVYDIVAFRNRDSRVAGHHIMGEEELRLSIPEATDDCFTNTDYIASLITLDQLPSASMVQRDWGTTLRKECLKGAKLRGLKLNKEYKDRLDRELKMIAEKKFEDYFFVIADMVQRAKQTMLVGPARGSAAGSLVCYLMGITDVDPIVHELMFERFIDVTRADLPDIDLDFPDVKRDKVIESLGEVYGSERVGRIGTINRYKAKSCLGIVAKELGIPAWEVNDVKNAMLDRSGGDARANLCVRDTLDSMDIGQALLRKYPQLEIAAQMEGHANHSGMHAAGVLVVNDPVTRYCAIDRSGAAQLDKGDAERLNMLKIDVLGLRTLSVLEDCLDQIGKDRDWLVTYPLDDKEAFEILNQDRFSGVFQFEGYALQSLTRQMKIRDFNDIVAITSLARPGPLHCGAANEFVARRIGQQKIVPLHPMVSDLLEESYGTVIYQEQVMAIGRVMGKLSWEDVSMLRKAMSKSLGDEFFGKYWEKFREGALDQGVGERDAKNVWDKICTFGSWAFNKSHAVSYGLISYWCAMLKAHHPLEYAAAVLRNEKDSEQGIRILRELVREGYEYKPFDIKHSTLNWEVADGRLIGGITNIKGIGPKKAQDIIDRRSAGKGLLPGQVKLLTSGTTPYDDIFEGERRFGDIYKNPRNHRVTSGSVSYVRDVNDPGEYVFLARIKVKNQRDLNEHDALAKRGGRKILRNNLFLNLTLEDDTGSIIAKISRYDYEKLGKPIVEGSKIGDWYIWRGKIRDPEWRIFYVSKWRRIEDDPAYPSAMRG
ncbi:MAG: DNA polymerase III subunit alpha [Bacilli bacterium]